MENHRKNMRPSTNTLDILKQRWRVKNIDKTDLIVVADDGRVCFAPDPIAIASLSEAIADHIVSLHNGSLKKS